MNERNTEQQLRYLEEVCIPLHRAGFETQPLESSQLPVRWNGTPLCRITGKGSVSWLIEKYGLRKVRFHDLRHPYVKHTTKIFSLRLMDFQAQAYPDARRKTRGACQLLRVGQSQSPVRPLCNRKRFS